MCGLGGGGSSSVEPTPVPKAVPGTTSVASGTAEESELSFSRTLEKQRKRRGAAATIRNEGGAGGIESSGSGKRTFGGE